MQCFYAVRGSKTHYFPHTVHYCCSSMLRLSETRTFLQSSSFWEARRALIGQLSSALWLANYLKRVTEMLRPSPYCDAVSWRDETKTIKPIIIEAFVASSGDIITDYNDLYCLFMRCIVPRKHFHVCICDRRNAKQQALLYTAQNSRLNRQKQKRTYRLWVRSVRLFLQSWNYPLYRNSLCASQHCRLLFQVQEIVLRELRRTHSNIWVELFWNTVVNTT